MNSMGHKTKKILAAFAAAGVMISFSGCVDKEQPSSDVNASSKASSTTAESSTENGSTPIDQNSSTASTPESRPKQSTDLSGTTESTNSSASEYASTISDSDERSYLCSIHENGHRSFIFHYVSDKLVKVEYIAYIKGVPEEVEAQNIVSEYSGVVMADKTDHYLFEIDMEQDGLKYLKDNFEMFKDLNDTSWSFVEKILIDFGYSCRENTLN